MLHKFVEWSLCFSYCTTWKTSTANQPWTFSGFGNKPTSTCPKPTTSKLKLAQRQSPANIFSPKEQPTVYHYARVPNARQVLNLAVVHIFLFFQEKSVSSKLVCTGSKLGTNTLALFTGFYSIFCARHQSSFVVARSQIYLLEYIDLYGKISRKTLTFCPSEGVTRDILSEERNWLSLPSLRTAN